MYHLKSKVRKILKDLGIFLRHEISYLRYNSWINSYLIHDASKHVDANCHLHPHFPTDF